MTVCRKWLSRHPLQSALIVLLLGAAGYLCCTHDVAWSTHSVRNLYLVYYLHLQDTRAQLQRMVLQTAEPGWRPLQLHRVMRLPTPSLMAYGVVIGPLLLALALAHTKLPRRSHHLTGPQLQEGVHGGQSRRPRRRGAPGVAVQPSRSRHVGRGYRRTQKERWAMKRLAELTTAVRHLEEQARRGDSAQAQLNKMKAQMEALQSSLAVSDSIQADWDPTATEDPSGITPSPPGDSALVPATTTSPVSGDGSAIPTSSHMFEDAMSIPNSPSPAVNDTKLGADHCLNPGVDYSIPAEATAHQDLAQQKASKKADALAALLAKGARMLQADAARRQAAEEEAARAAAAEASAKDADTARSSLAACVQHLMQLTEAAAEAGLDAAAAFSQTLSHDSSAAGTAVMESAQQNLASLLLIADCQQQMWNLVVAIGVLSLVVSVAQLVGLPLEEQAGLLIRRALLCKANNQTFAAFANWLHAAKLCPESQASLEVMAQLARWGEFSLLRCFIQDVKAVLAAEGRSIPVEFARQATEWRGMRCRVTRMLARPVHKDITDSSRQLAEALLADLKALLEAFPHNQPLACMKAKQEVHLGRFGDALATLDPFLGSHGVQASRWAVHMSIHTHWLTAGLHQMLEGLKQLIALKKSPLEGNVAHLIPTNASLEALLQKLAPVHCQWESCSRLLQQGDLSGAEQALTDVDNMSAELFSPALRAQQLCYWARLAHCQVQDVAAVGSKESAHWCMQALCACEWARALAPGIWRQVLHIQLELYKFLGAGPAAFLYGQVANEQEASLAERAHYRLLQVAAQVSPLCADDSLDPAKPRVNPAQLLGVTWFVDEDELNTAHNLRESVCYQWLKTATGFTSGLQGIGSLCAAIDLQAGKRLKDATATRDLLHFSCDLLTFRHMKKSAKKWFREQAGKLCGAPLPAAHLHMAVQS